MQRSTFRQPSDWHAKTGARLCILRRRYCSCITVHKKETYLYFKDLSEGAGSLGAFGGLLERNRAKPPQPGAGAAARVRSRPLLLSRKLPDRRSEERRVGKECRAQWSR